MAAVRPMKLVMAVHTVEEPTAKVPFSMILLLDHAKRGLPPNMRVRMVIPSDGRTSVSLWDTDDVELLQQWLAENLGTDCSSEMHEVQEEFTYGVMLELSRARTADRVAGNTKQTIGAIGETTSRAVERMGQGLRQFDDRTGVLSTTKEATTAAAKSVSAAVGRVAENEHVKTVMGSMQKGVQSGWATVSASLGFLGGHLTKPGDSAAQGQYADDQQHQHHGHGAFDYHIYDDDSDLSHTAAQPRDPAAAQQHYDALESLEADDEHHVPSSGPGSTLPPLSSLSVRDDRDKAA